MLLEYKNKSKLGSRHTWYEPNKIQFWVIYVQFILIGSMI